MNDVCNAITKTLDIISLILLVMLLSMWISNAHKQQKLDEQKEKILIQQ